MSGEDRTCRDLYAFARRRLPSSFEAEQLLFHVCGKRAYQLSPEDKQPVRPDQWRAMEDLCRRREAGEPLQYLLGEWEFYSLPFFVGEGVLIPRGDTETLVDAALEALRGHPAPTVLDLCAGSGCVGIAIAKNCPSAEVTAVERSEAAFGYLTRNIARNGVGVVAVREDLYRYRPPRLQTLVVSNPPYIPQGELAGLQREVRREPVCALDGGEDGLDFYRGIVERYGSWIETGGWIAFEVGAGQSSRVAALLAAAGFAEIEVHRDLGGVERAVLGRR